MLELLFSNPPAFIVIFGGLVLAIGLHEAAHCYMADRLGDPTPRSLGRLTLNPLVHLDPVGTLLILISGFGWGKASPFDPYNLRDPRRDTALIALAGPAVNILMAAVLALALRLFTLPFAINIVLYSLVVLNLNLALFNLLPVPPLDGSKIAGLFMSHESAARYQHNSNLMLLLLLLLPIFAGRSLALLLISPVSRFLLSLLLP